MTNPAVTRKTGLGTTVWTIIWALLPLASIGFLAAPVMVFAAYRLRHWLQILLTIVYAGALIGMFTFDPPHSWAGESALYSTCILLNWLLATGHAFVIRRKVFGLDDVSPALARQQEALRQSADAERMRTVAREVVSSDPRRALELQVGRPDLANRDFPDGGLVDVNNVPESTLRDNLGLSRQVAHDIVERRQATQGFGSATEVSVLLNLPPHLFENLSDRMVFLPRPVSDPGWDPRT